MDKNIYYVVLQTRWGWFGLCGYENALLHTGLPSRTKEAVKRTLLTGLGPGQQDKGYFGSVQERIKAYFEGSYVDFADVPVCLGALTGFQRRILNTLRNITYGHTVSYKQLAAMAISPRACRAVGAVMAVNPLPLIIPCHRVIRTDGALGGFSGEGGIAMKKRLLALENRVL